MARQMCQWGRLIECLPVCTNTVLYHTLYYCIGVDPGSFDDSSVYSLQRLDSGTWFCPTLWSPEVSHRHMLARLAETASSIAIYI